MMHRSRPLLALAGLLAALTQASAKGELDLTANPDTGRHLSIFQYTLVKTLGFKDLGNNTAYTFLYKDRNDKDPRGYSVSIAPGKDGVKLFFSATEPCVAGQDNSDDVLEVNGRNIQAHSGCRPDAKGVLRVGYLLKTAEGNAYALEEFKNKTVVVVRFRAMSIPFESEDFVEVWRKANQNAL